MSRTRSDVDGARRRAFVRSVRDEVIDLKKKYGFRDTYVFDTEILKAAHIGEQMANDMQYLLGNYYIRIPYIGVYTLSRERLFKFLKKRYKEKQKTRLWQKAKKYAELNYYLLKNDMIKAPPMDIIRLLIFFGIKKVKR